MSESLPGIRWVSPPRGRPVFYTILSLFVMLALVMAYAFLVIAIFPTVPSQLTFFGVVVIFVAWFISILIVCWQPDPARPAEIKSGAASLGLAFVDVPKRPRPSYLRSFPLPGGLPKCS